MTMKENIREIKSQFFALRNGVIADRLRTAGSPYKIIFGLLIPQIEQIAAKVGQSVELAEALWENATTRESQLLATMVYPIEAFTSDKAVEWARNAATTELVDSLCFRLARHLDDAEQLVIKCYDNWTTRYFALRLAMNLLILRKISDSDGIAKMAKASLKSGSGREQRVARQIVDEIDFLILPSATSLHKSTF